MAKQARPTDPSEQALLQPTLSLFPDGDYWHAFEVPLGWRKIDLVCVERSTATWIAIELKLRDWRGALLQAAINQQLVDKSYVAMWHRHVPNALKRREMFAHYHVGLIEVAPNAIQILFDFNARPPALLKQRHREIVAARLHKVTLARKIADEAISLLPA